LKIFPKILTRFFSREPSLNSGNDQWFAVSGHHWKYL